ncbi:hypothetical protein L6R52_16900 [Myxococcota bacterium]|nr:hypothetical protein [Myxococcota bacterium]
MGVAIAWLGLVVGVTAVHVEDAEDLPRDTARAFAESIVDALGGVSGAPHVLDDDAVWEACSPGAACLDEIRARTRAEDVVLVRLFAGPTTIRAILRFVSAGAHAPTHTVQGDVPRATEAWPDALGALARELYTHAPRPEPEPTDAALVAEPPAKAEPRSTLRQLAPWLGFAASAASLAAGVGFGLSSDRAKDELATRFVSGPELDALEARGRDHAIFADVFFGAAIAGAITSVVLLVTD